MQVQSATKQTAVGWTTATRITRSAAGTVSDIVPGVCVVVRSAAVDASATAGPGAATAQAGAVTAGTVQVAAAVNGACADVFGGGGGIRSAGGGPSGAPTDRPTGDQVPPGAGAVGRGLGGSGVAGLVMSVGGGDVIVASAVRADGGGGADPAASAAPSTTPVTVTLSAGPTVTTITVVPASAIAVGLCATAVGATDDIGKVTATSIVLRDAVDGVCPSQGGPRG